MLKKLVNKLFVWDANNYSSKEEALLDNAIEESKVSGHYEHSEQDYINGFVAGMRVASARLVNDREALSYQLVACETYICTAEVLQWNSYMFEVNAMNPEEALEKINKSHPTNFELLDSISRVEDYTGTDSSVKNIVIDLGDKN